MHIVPFREVDFRLKKVVTHRRLSVFRGRPLFVQIVHHTV